MKHRIVFSVVWAFICLVLAGRAEILDRMVAIVDGRVVTSSDLERHRRIATLFGDPVPGDERGLLDEVIENLLVQAQIEQFQGIRVGEPLIDSYIEQLADAGDFDPVLLREAVRERLRRINYFNLRFRRFTVATEQEILNYYETVFLPAAASEGLEPVPPLAAVRDLVQENVITEKADHQIATWTDGLLRRSGIEIVLYQE